MAATIIEKTGMEEPDEWWEEALLSHPLFQQRIVQARQSAREGKGISIEQLRAELNIEPPVVTTRIESDDEQVTIVG